MRDWLSLLNKHPSDICLVIGNGPSLRDVPASFLKRYKSFGSNRIYLRDEFTPDYYVCVNPLVLDQCGPEIDKIPTTKFLPEKYASEDDYALHSIPTPLFSYNPAEWIYEGYTVTFVALQIAYYMGFGTVLLVGVDHRYIFEGRPNETNIYQGPDINHFDERYFQGMAWHNPDLQRSEEAYSLARAAFEADGRHVYNLTPNTELRIFPISEQKEWE